jgi:serine/threonine protein kinase
MNFKDRYKYNSSTNLLGKGGFSRVFKATDLLLERDVALKIFNSEQSARYDLITEIKKVIKLDHPNLCRYFDVAILESINALGESEKVQVGIMEYLDGGDIRTYTRNHPEKRDKLLIDVLKGLSFLHKHGIIHRDLKPQNILIKNTIDGPVAKITDFGISKALSNEQSSSSTLLGTIEYMAPEQFNPGKYGINGLINTNLDLWSYGLMMYEIINGQSLFGSRGSNTSAEQVMNNILSDDYYSKVQTLPEPYRKIVSSCLVKDAKMRVNDAEQLIPLFNNNYVADSRPVIPPKPSGETEIIRPVSKDTIPLKVPKTPPAKPEYKPTPKPDQKPLVSKKSSRAKYVFLGVGVLLIAITAVAWMLNKNNNSSVKFDDFIMSEVKTDIASQNYSDGINLIRQFYDDITDKKKARGLLEEAYKNKWTIDSTRTEIYRTGQYLDVGEFSEGMAWIYANGLYGFINQKNEVIIEPKYQRVRSFKNGCAVVVMNNKYGYINKSGKMIWPAELEFAMDFSDGYAALNKKGLWGFIDSTGNLITSFQYDQVGEFYANHAVVAKDGNYGVINNTNKIIIPLEYDFASNIYLNKDLIFLSKNKKSFLADTDGKIVSKEYDEMNHILGSGYIKVRNGNKFGYLEENGKEVIPPDYEDATIKVKHDQFLVKQMGKFGFINSKNKKITEFIYDTCSGFVNNYAAVSRNGKWGFINRSGKEIIPVEYNMVDIFRGNIAIVKKGAKYGIIDANNKEVFAFDYDGLESADPDNELFIARKGEEMGVFNKERKTILKFGYSKIQVSQNMRFIVAAGNDGKYLVYDRWNNGETNLPSFVYMEGFNDLGTKAMSSLTYEDGKYKIYDYARNKIIISEYYTYESLTLFKYEKSGKYGFMNLNFEEKIPAQYTVVEEFSDGLARVAQNGKYGFIDHTGRVIIPLKYAYDAVTKFNSGRSRVYTGYSNDGYIDKKGEFIFSTNMYNANEIFTEYGLTLVNKGGVWGVIDITGKTIVEPKYIKDAIDILDFGIVIKNNNGFVKLLNFNGEEIIPYKYKTITMVQGLLSCSGSNDDLNAIYSYSGKELCKGDFYPPYSSYDISTLFKYTSDELKYYNIFGEVIYEPRKVDMDNENVYRFESNIAVSSGDTTVRAK